MPHEALHPPARPPRRRLWLIRVLLALGGVGAMGCIAAAIIFFVPGLMPRLLSLVDRDNEPVVPFRIAQNLYYVGASDVTSFLIVTPQGLILIDGGYAQTAPQILGNIRALGFDPRGVKILLNTHAHVDHAGGLAILKAATGAQLYASPRDAVELESGGRNDFAFGDLGAFQPVHVDHLLRDGEQIRLGQEVLTAHFTPGHTKGCTTWTFPVTVDRKEVQALDLCSVTMPGYRLVGNQRYPEIAADFVATYRTLKSLRCDVFLGSHGFFFDLKHKHDRLLAGIKPNPFLDPRGCRLYIDRSEAAFRAELTRQQNPAP